MRYCLILTLILAGCTLGGGAVNKPQPAENPITGAEISVTSLDNATKPSAPLAAEPNESAAKKDPQAVEMDTKPSVEPKANAPKPAVPEVAPPVELAPEVLACSKQGGDWISVSREGGKACVQPAKDAGKSCRKKSDCDGECLAKSRSCAPVLPLFGCNDILQNDGSMVTLCID